MSLGAAVLLCAILRGRGLKNSYVLPRAPSHGCSSRHCCRPSLILAQPGTSDASISLLKQQDESDGINKSPYPNTPFEPYSPIT